MKLTIEDLPRHLSKGLQPLYVIHGAAMLLAIEAADAIRAAARNDGYSEREILIADTGFKWAELRESAQSLSLFSSRKVLDLRIPTGKPGVEGAQALQDYCQQLNADTVTLVSLPRLDGTTMKLSFEQGPRRGRKATWCCVAEDFDAGDVKYGIDAGE